MASQVLVVEDDDKIAAPLVRTLEREGYEVRRLAEGTPALAALAETRVDLLLLDLGLPDVDGLDVCRRAREQGYLGGIIILTARDGELDRVVGLDVGADDYLAKPFGLAELLARARALLRRSGGAASETAAAPAPSQSADAPATDGLRVDVQARRIWVGDTELAATTKEFDVLAMLDASRGAVVSREQLISGVWDENWYGSTKMLDTTMGRVRQKLEEADAPVRITTVRGVGFRLEDAPDA
ncbi:response regulator transcription factor [Nocardioides sp. Y6]|uniref:Response regulator transcription factor n=1 Tax=Nocardioides malaquae TaxID=2773426 RepID=A0ABR9RWP0_9ACTN|nr:response regulator transcription factor [Nocardioides malaquae]MBE7326003.1 response regulator transcription factor [Nocardioides malaquae]